SGKGGSGSGSAKGGSGSGSAKGGSGNGSGGQAYDPWGTSGDDNLKGTSGDDVWNGTSGNDSYYAGEGYDQINYDGSLSDYKLVKNDDGSVTVTKPNGDADTLRGIDGFWFNGEGEWYSLDYALELSGDSDDSSDDSGDDGNDDDTDNGGSDDNANNGKVYDGTDGEDVWYEEAGDNTYNGGDSYDQLNYYGSISDYAFVKNDDGSVTVTKENGDKDTLNGIDGFWFNGDSKWYSLDDALEMSGYDGSDDDGNDGDTGNGGSDDNANDGTVYDGTDGEDVWFEEAGNNTYNGGESYDQLNYYGSISDYSFVKNDDGSVTVTKENGDTDTLNGIDGFWFNGDSKWYSLDDALEMSGGAPVDDYDDGDDNDDPVGAYVQGTDGNDTFYDASGDQIFDGGEGFDQVNYRGALSDYRLEKQDDGSVTVTHESGEVDTLVDIEGLWFDGEGEWYSTDYAVEESDVG
ncbi:MAG: hypothetical protein HRU27_18155, partial [Rhizobiaceae bacterium]|nr:hypothetical protein [Rhizobiaceae bacterium]